MMEQRSLLNIKRIVCNMRTMDKIGQTIINLLIGLIIVIAAFTLYSFISLEVMNKDYVSIFGYTYFEVASGSMAPTINKEDMVIVKLNSNYQEEDIITYKLNEDFITHRVIRIDTKTITTKGDANNTKDTPISKDSILGKVIFVIPNFGIWKKVFMIVSATESITSLTVISVGIPTVTIITLDMTYTCSLHLTLKMIFRFFHF